MLGKANLSVPPFSWGIPGREIGHFAMGFPWQNAPQKLPWRPPVPLKACCWPLCHGIPMAKCSTGAPLEASCWPLCHGIPMAKCSPGAPLEASCSPGGLLLASLPWDSHGKVLPRSFPGGLLLGFLPWDSRGSVVPRIPVCRTLGGLVLEGSASVWGLQRLSWRPP